MTIHSARHNRIVAWLGVIAIALIAITPTVSQVRAGGRHAMTAGMVMEHRAHEASSAALGDTHHHDGTSPDDCWKKCGYCDFFSHSPSIASFAFAAAFEHLMAPAIATRLRVADVRASYAQAAQPRGPPSILL